MDQDSLRCANARERLANRLQFPSLGNRVSSDGALVIIVGGGKEAARVVTGYIPQKAC